MIGVTLSLPPHMPVLSWRPQRKLNFRYTTPISLRDTHFCILLMVVKFTNLKELVVSHWTGSYEYR
jgi:hypothetical protein